MEFIKYQHIERLGTSEVESIEFGETYVFPKIDGTNGSLWLSDGELKGGARTRTVSLENDNQGFFAWAIKQQNIIEYLKENPTHRLFGEWLIPHSLKTYRETAWQTFYVFDVAIDKTEDEITHEGDDKVKYLHYEFYKPLLEKHNIYYIHPIAIFKNGTYEQYIKQIPNNIFLIEDGKGHGEGIVIKNYDYKNKYGRQTWAKIVTSEFKEKHYKQMGAPEINGKKMIEEEIAQKFITTALVEKEHSKIVNDGGWTSKQIPRLLNTVFYSLIKEDMWEILKEYKNPAINFKTLLHFSITEMKKKKPEFFGLMISEQEDKRSVATKMPKEQNDDKQKRW